MQPHITIYLCLFCFSIMNNTLKTSYLTSLDKQSKNLLGLIIFLSYIWGSSGKIMVYNHIKTFKIRERPINALIIFGEIIYHSVITFVFLNLMIVLWAQKTPASFFDDHLGLTINEHVSTCCDSSVYVACKIYFLTLEKNVFSFR